VTDRRGSLLLVTLESACKDAGRKGQQPRDQRRGRRQRARQRDGPRPTRNTPGSAGRTKKTS